MFKLIVFLTFVGLTLDVRSQDVIGNVYEAEINASCREMSDGGCMTYTYRVLKFEKDSVFVSYKIVPYCHPEKYNDAFSFLNNDTPKSYKWEASDDKIIIENFDIYGKLDMIEEKLYGLDDNERKITYLKIK